MTGKSSDCRKAKHGRCPHCTCPCHKASPRWHGLTPTGRTTGSAYTEPGDPIRINCHGDGHPDIGLCDDCAADLRLVLADVPQLLDDLDIAISRATRFVEHGTNPLNPPDEKGDGIGGHPAVLAQQRLTAALAPALDWFDTRDPVRLATLLGKSLVSRVQPGASGTRPRPSQTDQLPSLQNQPELKRLARDLTAAATRTHKVIDRPRDLWHYGPCPDCGRDIWQDRVHHDTDAHITCPCGYNAHVTDHFRTQLSANEDRWMSIRELIGAFEIGGMPVTADQITSWDRRHGLPREQRPLIRWQNGELTTTGHIWTYRVGDVMDMLIQVQTRKGRLVS